MIGQTADEDRHVLLGRIIDAAIELAKVAAKDRKDAERYRWLRRRDSEHAEYLIGLYSEHELDEKIDEELRRLIDTEVSNG